jgi:membrane dipeptidase
MDEDSGPTAYGRQIIGEMEGVGMVLCLSHVGHRTARDAMEYAKTPVIFSHSNPSGAYPHVRNISDELMRMCAAKGGADNSTDIVVRHIDYAVGVIGPEHVGLGLDYALPPG